MHVDLQVVTGLWGEMEDDVARDPLEPVLVVPSRPKVAAVGNRVHPSGYRTVTMTDEILRSADPKRAGAPEVCRSIT